jgi:hypothetical protein
MHIRRSNLCAFDLLQVLQLDHLEQPLVVQLQLAVPLGSESLVEGGSADRVDHSELRAALLQLQLQLRQSVQLRKAQLRSEFFSEDEVVLEFLGPSLGLGLVLLLLGSHLHLLALAVLVVVVDLLLELGLLPVVPFVFDSRLEVDVDVGLLDLGLALIDEQRELIV